MTSKNDKVENQSEIDSGITDNLNSRRSLLKKSGLLAPAVLSVTSRPVWAAGCSISGQMSGNVSHAQHEDDCDGQATAKSPGYWHKWIEIHDLLDRTGCVLWENLTDTKQEVFKEFKFYDNGEGTAINVLYNWSVAASANTDGRYNLYPTNYAATVTDAGDAITDESDQDTRHLVAALLSAAHPRIEFPYPGSEWTVGYILDKYTSSEVGIREQLLELIRGFYDGANGEHLEPANGLQNLAVGGNVGSAKNAYYWAIEFLGFPDPRSQPQCAVNSDPDATGP